VYPRKIVAELKKWAESPGRKPLVLRGARRVGKTTAVQMFSTEFDTFIPLNLEQVSDRALFTEGRSLTNVLEAIHFMKGIPRSDDGRTLIFIDEIQKSPEAVALLRYFYEEAPHLYVIAAGSSLETMIDTHISFPVGRVEFMLMHPFSFEEFLGAIGENSAQDALKTVPIPTYAHEKMADLFRRYMLVGGMPEAVKVFAESGELSGLDRIHESLIIAYLEDVEKYASSLRMVQIIRHVIACAWSEAAGRIRYDGFGNSNYLSRDIKEAFAILQKAFLFQVVHPVTATSLPLSPDTKKSPRLHTLDTGLVVFKTGMRKALFSTPDISAVFSGRIVEHIVGQELYAISSSPLHTLNFWARDKNQSNAEVDYVLPVNGKLVPVEVKSGASGRLRSLHAFINAAPHATAVRLYGGAYSVEKIKTIDGKPFTLINVPWYQAVMVEAYVEQAGKGQEGERQEG
jgi:predicted AAA+ superfamily ATPase